MTGYKLFRLIQTLSKAETAAAKKFLAVSGSGCQHLFQHILALPTGQLNGPDAKLLLYEAMYPGQAYHDNKLRKLMNRLTELLEAFLVQKELEKDEPLQQQLLARTLGTRSDYQLFKNVIETRLANLEAQPLRGLGHLQEKRDLLKLLYFHPETQRFTVNHDYFQQYIRCQEQHFILDSLMNGAECLLRNKTLSSKDSLQFLDAVRQAANLATNPVIAFFKKVFDFLHSSAEVVDLQALKATTLEVFGQMDGHEQRMALKLLIHLAMPMANTGSQPHNRFVFEMYQLGTEYQLLQHGGNYIDTPLFINVAISATHQCELDWAKNFIETHTTKVSPEDRSSAKHLCLASWHYQAGLLGMGIHHYKEAFYHASRIPARSNEIFELRVRSLQLRIKFDAFLAAAEPLDAVLEQARNFERHMKGNKTYSATKRNAYLSFVSHSRHLAKLANQPYKNPDEANKFLMALQSDGQSVLRHWLIEKAGALLPAPASQ